MVQERLYRHRLKSRLKPSLQSFGGVAGRNVVGNASAHIGHNYVYKTDISNFFPSITIDRVNRLFLRQLGCSYEVSRILTRLCTYDYHLALGLVTSPILADQILRTVDQRMAALCEHYKLTLTRFVDDITVSGNFDIQNSVVPEKLSKILKSHGFSERSEKRSGGYLSDGVPITGIQIKRRSIDVTKEYLQELDRQLNDHASLSRCGPFQGPFFAESQLAGRIHYVSWVNRNRRFGLVRKLNSIRWVEVWKEAERRGLVAAKSILTRRDDPAPDFSECYGVVPQTKQFSRP